MAIEFVQCDPDRVEALQAFFRTVYRPDYLLASSSPLFDWQFGPRGAVNRPYCCKLALLDNEIVGCLGYVPVEVSLAGVVRRGAWTANWVVDVTRRRLGIGPLLMRDLTREFDVTLVVGLSRESSEILPRMGWTDFGDLARYVSVLDPHAARALAPDAEIDWPARDVTGPDPVDRQTSINGVSRFSDDAMSLWDQRWGAQGAGTRRSAEFLNWRYAAHPLFEYRLFEAQRHGQLMGLAAYRVELVRDLPLRVGRIVEFLADPQAAGSLIDVILEDARAQQVTAMDFFCSRDDVPALLERGFVPGTSPIAAQIPILFQPIDRRRCGIPFMAYLRNLPERERALRWYVTKGDGDQDRPN